LTNKYFVCLSFHPLTDSLMQHSFGPLEWVPIGS